MGKMPRFMGVTTFKSIHQRHIDYFLWVNGSKCKCKFLYVSRGDQFRIFEWYINYRLLCLRYTILKDFLKGADPPFLTQPTSYDYDSPISEAGDITSKFVLLKNAISKVSKFFTNFIFKRFNFFNLKNKLSICQFHKFLYRLILLNLLMAIFKWIM